MRSTAVLIVVLSLGLASAALAAEYEIGGIAGGGFTNGLGVSSGVGTATTGFKPGATFGAFVGNNLYPHLSGEVHYTYQMSDLKLSSGGNEVTFSGMSHAVHYDFVYYPAKLRSKTQPFVAAGGGIKLYRGTGAESAYQPLNNFAYLTKAQDLRPLFTVGGGVKYQIGPRLYFRAEVRDYITPFPNKVITPAPGAKISGWLQDFVPMFGISFSF